MSVGRLDDHDAFDDNALDVNISKRFKSETETIFTQAFVNDSILIFREMKRKKPVKLAARRKLSLSLVSN